MSDSRGIFGAPMATRGYQAKLPDGRVINRNLPYNATDADIQAAFRDTTTSPRQQVVVNRPAGKRPIFGAELKSYDAPWRDDIAQKVSGWVGQLGFNERNAYQGTRNALSLADWVPGIGDAAAAADAVGSFRAGDYLKGAGQSALAAVGLVPVVGDMVAGAGRSLAREGLERAARSLPSLPESSALNFPRTPTADEMRSLSVVQSVPLDQVRRGNKLEWDRFNSGDHGVPLVKGYSDMPLAVQMVNGEHILLDGNHRTALAKHGGKSAMDMYVIPASRYDPMNAGRASVASKSGPSDDDLLAELGF